ncbi:hypothetical protein [Massilia orientalis]|uniref:Uncharacterized protein n=1 Tax=Massilia orientalis TaxID=3050128 RepID=A0ACC7MGF3_9BURK|nr:hypothetical protein [Massilia sp. YIM B02787]
MAQYNFRLFLKPTAIGQAIIDRLSPEGADRQALARRWIELGYALEQAGFRLDGTTVFQGARPLSLEAAVALPIPSHGLQSSAAGAVAHEARVAEASVPAHASLAMSTTSGAAVAASADAAAADSAKTPAAPAVTPVPAVVPAAPVPGAGTSPALNAVADNLRNLSA